MEEITKSILMHNLNNNQDNIINHLKQEFRFLMNEEISRGVISSFSTIRQKILYKMEISFLPFEDLISNWFNRITHLTYLEKYLSEPDNNEIIIQSNKLIQLDSKHVGQLKNVDINDIVSEDIFLSLKIISFTHNIEWNYKTPYASFFVSLYNEKFRLTIIHPSISITDQPKAYFRRISNKTFNFDDFNIDPNLKIFFNNIISNKKNIVISGSTGSGKTSFIKTLISLIPSCENILVLEDTHELIPRNDSQTNLISMTNTKGKSLKDYCQYTLRMRPDRVLIGELRSHEIIPFILMMNTGHNGLLTTIHANSSVDTIDRLSILFQLYNENSNISLEVTTRLICNNVDYIIHLKNKKITEVIKIIGSQKCMPIYETIYENY